MTPKPCPFCGRAPKFNTFSVYRNNNCAWVACEHCHAEGPAGESRDDNAAWEAWNRRANEDNRNT